MNTWTDVFVENTDRYADRLYAQLGDESLTYSELRDRVDRLATHLLALGVRPGQTLATWMTNSIEFVIAQWATYRVGCTLLPLYSYYQELELRHGLAETQTTVLFTSWDFAGKVEPREILQRVCPRLMAGDASDDSLPDLLAIILMNGEPGESALIPLAEATQTPAHAPALQSIQHRISPFDVMNVMYTSGTTGAPKAGRSLHSNNLATIAEWSALAELDHTDVVLAQVPMFTNFGCLYANGLAMYNGASLQITRTFDPAESLRLVREGGVTYIPGSPEIMRLMMEHPDYDARDFTKVRAAHVAGSSVDGELIARIIDEVADNVMQAYGMSECGGVSTASTKADPLQLRIDSVGRPLKSCRIRIVDADTLAECAVGEAGEIWFGDAWPGSCVGKGYVGNSVATSAAMTVDGWFRSGDLGRFDDKGYLYFVGRLKNMITVGGFNVYPAEIEKHLRTMEGITSAHVIGVDDARLGTVPVAFVTSAREGALSEPDILAYMRARVSSQKRPRRVWVVRDEELPMTPSGKVSTNELARMALERAAG